jgi:hypothetical protein
VAADEKIATEAMRGAPWLREVQSALEINSMLLALFFFLFGIIAFTSPLFFSAISKSQLCWTKEQSNIDYDTHTIKCNKLTAFDSVTLCVLFMFEAVAVTMVLPVLAHNPKQAHPGSYAKRTLDFQQDDGVRNMRRLIIDGKIKALVIMTPRVAEDEMDKQIEASCITARRVACLLAQDKAVTSSTRLRYPLKCIVCLIDEDRRPPTFNASRQQLHPTTGQLYHRTELHEMCDKFSSEPSKDWFPEVSSELPEPPVGGFYKVYSESIGRTESVKFEVHYIRRGWRPPRNKLFLERFWAFGETLCIVPDDNVFYKNQDGSVSIGRVERVDKTHATIHVEKSRTGKYALQSTLMADIKFSVC